MISEARMTPGRASQSLIERPVVHSVRTNKITIISIRAIIIMQFMYYFCCLYINTHYLQVYFSCGLGLLCCGGHLDIQSDIHNTYCLLCYRVLYL